MKKRPLFLLLLVLLAVLGDVVVSSAALDKGLLSKEGESGSEKDKELPHTVNLRDIKVIDIDEQGFTTDPSVATLAPPSEQQRLDTILRAFAHLPAEELARYGLSPSLSHTQTDTATQQTETESHVPTEIVAGTEKAERVFAAWTLRQRELQELMKGLLKPAEYMASLVQRLSQGDELLLRAVRREETKRETESETESESSPAEKRRREKERLLQDSNGDDNNTNSNSNTNNSDANALPLTLSEKTQILEELEDMLTDVDNARDFHTIGAWPALVALAHTHTNTHSALRVRALHCIGSLVKNQYDLQLYLLEALHVPMYKRVSDTQSMPVPVSGEELTQGLPHTENLIAYEKTDGLSVLFAAFADSAERILAQSHTRSESEREDDEELLKKSLYALSAALRGNLDVQERLLSLSQKEKETDFHALIHRLLLHSSLNTTTPRNESNYGYSISTHVERKLWSLVEDLLTEREEIDAELARHAHTLEARARLVREKAENATRVWERLREQREGVREKDTQTEEEERARREAQVWRDGEKSVLRELQQVRQAVDTLVHLSDEWTHTDTNTHKRFVALLAQALQRASERFSRTVAESKEDEGEVVVRASILRSLLSVSTRLSRHALSKTSTEPPEWARALRESAQRVLSVRDAVLREEVERERHEDIFALADGLLQKAESITSQ